MKLLVTNKPPKPSKRYAFIAKRAQKYGVQVAPDDFETIDAFTDALSDWQDLQRKRERRQEAAETFDREFLKSCRIERL
jgi:hypothetical protein